MGSRLGFVNILLVAIIIGLAILLSGTLFGQKFTPGNGSPLTSSYTCCDSGDGAACKPLPDKKVIWKGTNSQPEEYALIKSGIALSEGSGHLDEHEPTTTGERVFVNTGDTTAPYCPGEDTIGDSSGCILNDEVIYICKSECPGSVGTGKFDAYFRMSDIPTPGVPDAISNCAKPKDAAGQQLGQPTIVFDQQEKRENLQLQTFKVIQQPISIPWLSPYCKPAVYLYPEQTSYISVRVKSSEPLTYSDPFYPAGGWGVLAEPNGILNYQNKIYDYLYYETKVADSNIKKPSEGFVVEKGGLKTLFSNILPNLGLNLRESKQFSDYWVNVLPDTNYYFVGIIPQKNLDELTTLDILPQPQTEIRVTLYFEVLDEKINVKEPIIVTPKRTGFTVVEWGGIFKRHPSEVFSCFE